MINFRAWVKSKGIMRDVLGLHYNRKLLWLRHGEKNNIMEKVEDVIIMQGSGVVDKTGKEVFEGDILYKEDYWLLKVERDRGSFWIRDYDTVRYNNSVTNHIISELDFKELGYEVVGHIHDTKILDEFYNI